MKKKTKILLGLSIFLLLILTALAFVYFVAFERFVLVMDPAWSYLLPSSELSSMRFALAQKGYHLVVVHASATNLDDSSSFTSLLLSLKCSEILLGPLASASAVQFGIDVTSLLENAVVYGMWSQSCNNFDVTLISNISAGWKDAITKVTTKTMAQNVAMVYDSETISVYEAIDSIIATGDFLGYYYDGQSKIFARNTVSDMNEKQVVIALCPHLENLYDLVSLDTSISWIVDYRYSQIIPKKQLFGTVLPDLTGFVKNYVNVPKDTDGASGDTVDTLYYKYEAK